MVGVIRLVDGRSHTDLFLIDEQKYFVIRCFAEVPEGRRSIPDEVSTYIDIVSGDMGD